MKIGNAFFVKEEIMKKYEVIKFKDNEFEMDVNVSPDEDTVWLTIEQIAFLFRRGTVSHNII